MITSLRPNISLYGIPVVSVGIALLLTLLLKPFMQPGYSLLFLTAVMISARYGGLRAGLLATSLAIVSLCYFFMAPTYSIWVSEINGIAWLVLFVTVSTLISSLNETRKRAEEKLRLANQELESHVAERTAELTLRNNELQSEVAERTRIAEANETLINNLQQALTGIKALSGMLPVCSHCKKIRNSKGLWIEFDSYVREHSEVAFSQSLCPECAKALYPQYPFISTGDSEGPVN